MMIYKLVLEASLSDPEGQAEIRRLVTLSSKSQQEVYGNDKEIG